MTTKISEPVVMAELVESRPIRSAAFPVLLALGIIGAIGAFFVATAALLFVVAIITARSPADVAEQGESGIIHVTDATFEAEVLSADLPGPILVDFHASWCGPCRTQSKILTRFAAQHGDVKIAKVDVDQSPTLASRYNVRSIPTLLVVKGGEVTASHTGVASESVLLELLKR